jgi:hypothetical protein
MSSNPNEKFEQLLGRELSDRQKQELLRIGKVLEIADNDALWSVVVLLYSFDNRLEKTHKQIERAANAAAESSAKQAEAHINEAVKLLAPSIQKTVERSAQRAMGRLQIAESMWIISLAIVIVGLYGGVCFALGNGSYWMLQQKKITMSSYWQQMQWAIASGFIAPGFVIAVYLVLRDGDYDWQKFGYGLILLGGSIAVILLLNLVGLFR